MSTDLHDLETRCANCGRIIYGDGSCDPQCCHAECWREYNDRLENELAAELKTAQVATHGDNPA